MAQPGTAKHLAGDQDVTAMTYAWRLITTAAKVMQHGGCLHRLLQGRCYCCQPFCGCLEQGLAPAQNPAVAASLAGDDMQVFAATISSPHDMGHCSQQHSGLLGCCCAIASCFRVAAYTCRDYYENTLHYFKHQLKADLKKPMQW